MSEKEGEGANGLFTPAKKCDCAVADAVADQNMVEQKATEMKEAELKLLQMKAT